MINANDASGADEVLSKSHDKYIEKVPWKALMINSDLSLDKVTKRDQRGIQVFFLLFFCVEQVPVFFCTTHVGFGACRSFKETEPFLACKGALLRSFFCCVDA